MKDVSEEYHGAREKGRRIPGSKVGAGGVWDPKEESLRTDFFKESEDKDDE